MRSDSINSTSTMAELAGKTAFITGGSSGIGLGIARACLAERMNVVITYLTETHLAEARQYFQRTRGSFHAIRADVRDRVAMTEAAAEASSTFGAVDLICANAGLGISSTICEATELDWVDAVQTNILGMVNTIHPFVSYINTGHSGPAHIVGTASMSGLFHGAAAGVYTTTKFAVVGFLEALRAELKPRGVGVSVFCPGFVQSKIYEQFRNRSVDRAQSTQAVSRVRELMPAGMPALECGQRVLRGIQRNEMYILTHAEYREGCSERFSAVLGAFEAEHDETPAERVLAERAVLKHAVYAEEVIRQGSKPIDSNR